MTVPKIHIDPANTTAIELAFAGIAPQRIDHCNWSAKFPYAPQVEFRIFHTGACLMVRFNVAERYTAARVTEDNGEVWTDSCVEFFLALDDAGYYNFEATAIGRLLVGYRKSRNEGVEHASAEILSTIARIPSLPAVPFEEREGDNRWSLTLAIPATALFKHRITAWDGIAACANLYKCGDNLSHPHFLSWKPIRTENPDFHRPEFFEQIKFSK